MAFNIILQKNMSEKNCVTKELTNIATLSGVLKADTSIIDPVIIVEVNLANYINCNYMTIPTFGRSYFVNNIKSIRNGLVELSAHVDVLSSFATALKTNNAIIHRQAIKWNLYLNDGSFRVYQNPNVLTREFPSGFSTQEFVLAVAGSPSTETPPENSG